MTDKRGFAVYYLAFINITFGLVFFILSCLLLFQGFFRGPRTCSISCSSVGLTFTALLCCASFLTALHTFRREPQALPENKICAFLTGLLGLIVTPQVNWPPNVLSVLRGILLCAVILQFVLAGLKHVEDQFH
jgi:hypothetical protein